MGYGYDAAPTVGQMLELQSLGVVLAKDQRKLRSRGERAHVFLSREIERVVISNDETFQYSSHRFTGRVARIGYRQWSMRLAEAYWQRDPDADSTEGFRTSYSFVWTDKSVTSAKKSMHLPNSAEDRLEDIANIESAMDDLCRWPAFWGAVFNCEQVTAGDCHMLIADVSAFCNQSRSENTAI